MRKAINFDLDTTKMKAMSLYPQGYKLLKKSFKKFGFKHRQYSGYESKVALNSLQVSRIVEQIVIENPWLSQCIKKVDVTDIGKQYDLTKFIIQVSKGNVKRNEIDRIKGDIHLSTIEEENEIKKVIDRIEERDKKRNELFGKIQEFYKINKEGTINIDNENTK